jgi:hypothetical protein
MSKSSSGFNESYEPVSPVDIVSGAKRPRFAVLAEEKRAHSSTRSVRTNSTASTFSLKTPRTARFAEATTVHSPVTGPNEHRSPFADPPKMEETEPQPSDVGFGYISNDTAEQQVTMKADPNGQAGAPLKSAMKVPGTPGRLLNPLSPTFREEQMLEKEEEKTEVSQAKDLVCQNPSLPTTTLLTLHPENQDASSYGQDGPAWCQLLMLSDRPLHAEHNLYNLQLNQIYSTSKQPSRLGHHHQNLAPDHSTCCLLRLSCILRGHLLGVLERRPQASREDSCLLHRLRNWLLYVQRRYVGRCCRYPSRIKGKRQWSRRLGLVLQGQQAETALPGRSPLRSGVPPAKLESYMLHHRSRRGDHHHLYLRRCILSVLLEEPPQEEHGRPRQSPLRSLPSAAENPKRTKYTRLFHRTDTALSTLPSHVKSRPIQCC